MTSSCELALFRGHTFRSMIIHETHRRITHQSGPARVWADYFRIITTQAAKSVILGNGRQRDWFIVTGKVGFTWDEDRVPGFTAAKLSNDDKAVSMTIITVRVIECSIVIAVIRYDDPFRIAVTSQWPPRHVKSHSLDYFLKRLFKLTSKKTSKPALLALCEGNPPVVGGFPYKGPVTRKTFPLHDVIMVLDY